jgi:microsomal dipeptidase-like Zn-dependent dipeptidase
MIFILIDINLFKNLTPIIMKIIDIHCHPSTKINFGHDIQKRHRPVSDLLPTGMHVDLPRMIEGDVACAVSVHYIVEKGLLDANQNVFLKAILKIATFFGTDIDKLTENGNVVMNTLDSINATNTAIRKAQTNFQVSIPTNFSEFKTAWENNDTIMLHSIEGGHSLGNDDPVAMVENYANLGVCQITIAHFFQNIVVSSQGGIPPKTKEDLHIKNIPMSFIGLNPENLIGEQIVREILNKGMILDLVHCPPSARSRIFEINKERLLEGKQLRPLVFSHTGIKSCIDDSIIDEEDGMSQGDVDCLPTNEEILQIIECKGVIGVIFMNYWLSGKEEDNAFSRDEGLDLVINTIVKLRDIGLGSCDHIAIGSDLDGFTQVPDDLVTASDMQKIPSALEQAGFSEMEIRKICNENYRRVLELGWGNN